MPKIGAPTQPPVKPQEEMTETIDTPTEDVSEEVAETPAEEAAETPEEQKQEEQAGTEVPPPVDEGEFYALPPKQAYQIYLAEKTAKEALQAEADKKMEDAIQALRTELETKHKTDLDAVKEAIRNAIYETD